MVRTWIVTAALGAAASACFAGRGTLTIISPPEGVRRLDIVDVSADGRVAAANAWNSSGLIGAFRWDRQHGARFMPVNPAWPSGNVRAHCISADGSTLIGKVGSNQLNNPLVRWREGDGEFEVVAPLPMNPGLTVTGTGASDDGEFVGYSAYYTYRSNYQQFAGLWPTTSYLALPDLVNVADVRGSGDAVVLAGTRIQRYELPRPIRAFRYTLATSLVQELPIPSGFAGDTLWRTASIGLSPNGLSTLGWIGQNWIEHYVRWDSNGESHVLDCPEWANGCTVYAISDSSPRGGPLAVGYTQNQTATIWWPDGRPESLWARLNLQGAGIDDNTRLLSATSVSSNGRVIVGNARYLSRPIEEQFGFIATLGSPCPADIDDGHGQGVPDEAVELADLLMAIAWFESGDERFDIDDGSGAGVRDWAVTIDDLVYFLRRYEAGC